MVYAADDAQQASCRVLDFLPELAERDVLSFLLGKLPVAVLVGHDFEDVTSRSLGLLVVGFVKRGPFLVREAHIIDGVERFVIGRARPAELRELDESSLADRTLAAVDSETSLRLDAMCRAGLGSRCVIEFDGRREKHLNLCAVRHREGNGVSFVLDTMRTGERVPDFLLEVVKCPGLLLLLLLRKIPLRILKFSLD